TTWTQVEDSGDMTSLLALLASHDPGEGASLIGIDPTGTVQDFYDAQQLANASFLPLAGGTMTGNLILNADPTIDLQAATKHYVDTVAIGLIVQPSCRVATTGALTVTYDNGVS